MDDGALRRRLEAVVEKTMSAQELPPASYWVDDVAGERRVQDDMDAGRFNWRAAHRNALAGITALEKGDLETAELCAWAATGFYIAALEARVRPSDMDVLQKPARRRGAPRKK